MNLKVALEALSLAGSPVHFEADLAAGMVDVTDRCFNTSYPMRDVYEFPTQEVESWLDDRVTRGFDYREQIRAITEIRGTSARIREAIRIAISQGRLTRNWGHWLELQTVIENTDMHEDAHAHEKCTFN